MKKTKMFLTAIFLVTSTWLAKAQGTSCNTAIQLTMTVGNSLGMQSTTANEMWYYFTAADKIQVWDIITKNKYQRRVVGVTAYDNCSNVVSYTDQYTMINDSTIELRYPNLTTSNNYYLKLIFETVSSCTTCISGSTGYYDIKYVSKTAAYTACTTTPCSTNPPSTTCEYVCNGGFEINNGAPGGVSEIERACGWNNHYYTTGLYSGQCGSGATTTDFFNTSSSVASADIPCNANGYESERTGLTGYVGVFASSMSSAFGTQGCWIEALSTPLRYSLNNNKAYKLSYYVSLSDVSPYNTNDNMGFQIINTSTVTPSTTSYTFNTSNISRVGWTQLTMTFQPTNSEDVLMIGAVGTTTNRTSASGSYSSCAANNSTFPNDTYYYIDDVSLVEVTQMSITASSTAGCSGETWTLTASGASTYTWSTGSSATSITVAPTSTTVYTLTGSTASSVSCYVPAVTVTISPTTCCTNPNSGNFTLRDVNLVAYGTGGATTWTTLVAGGYYTGAVAIPSTGVITNTMTVANSMTISTPVTFSLCNIAVTEDDAITQNSTTYIRRSWLWGCDKLWEGIVSTARLEVYDSFIEDAYQSILAVNSGTYAGLICDNVVFNKNYNSITVSGTVSESNFNITGCIFTSRTISSALHDFSPPRYTTSIAPINGKVPAKIKASTTHSITAGTIRSNIGIYTYLLSSTSTVNISIGATSGTPTLNASYTNYFDYINGGIYNTWSKIFVKNNNFSNIINTGIGNAIGAIVHYDPTLFSIDKITKTKVGDAVGGSIYKNIFNAVKDGVVATNSGTLEVSGNDFTTVSRYGVSVSSWYSSTVQAEPVTISANSYTDCLYPFYAYDNNYIKASINTNTVTHSAPTYTSGYCAYINELSKPANATYSITSNKYSGMLNGIYFINTSGACIVGNIITIKKPGAGVYNAGVLLSNTDNTIVSDNIIDCNATNSASWYTFGLLSDACVSNTVQCNTITKVGSCLKFQGSGSPTYIHDNSFNNNGSDPCLFGVLLDNGANIGSIGLYESSTWKRSRDLWGDFLYGGSNNGADTYCQGTTTASVGGTIHYDATQTPTTAYTPSVNLNSGGSNVSFTPSNNTNSNGYNCGIGARFATPNSNGGGKNTGSDLYTGTKKRIIMRNGNATSREIANENGFQVVDSLLMDYIATRNNSSLNSAKSVNSSISASNNVEQNQKNFNAIYAVYLEDDSLVSNNQIQDLGDMARLCPFTEGLAVYQARGLMRKWDDSTFYYNTCEINVPTQEEHARNVAKALNGSNVITDVYPNPCNGSLTVKSSVANCIFEVYDIVGKRFLSQRLNENETKIDVTSFNNGTYLYKITDNANKVIKNGKLVISH